MLEERAISQPPPRANLPGDAFLALHLRRATFGRFSFLVRFATLPALNVPFPFICVWFDSTFLRLPGSYFPPFYLVNMPPKGASTKLNPVRLQTIPHLRIRHPNKNEGNPCVAVMSSMLSTSEPYHLQLSVWEWRPSRQWSP